MADYYPLLARAVAALPNSSRETRSAIYERARKALLGQLQTLDPPVSSEHIAAESKALDDAIARLEAELAQEAGKTEAPAAAPVAPAQTPAPSPPPPPVSPGQAAPAQGSPAQGSPAQGSLAQASPAAAGPPPASGLRQPPPPPRFVPPGSPPGSRQPPPPPTLRPAPPPMRPAPPPVPGAPPGPFDRAAPPSGGQPEAPLARADEAPEAEAPPRGRPRDEVREGPPIVPAKLPGSRGEPARPAAPTRPETGRVVSRQMLIWIPLILLIGGGIGFAAWRLRVPQEDFAKPRASVAESRQAQGSAKINERADGSAAPPAAPAPAPQQQARAPQQPAPAPAPAPQPQAQAQAEQPAQAAPRAPAAEQAAPVAQRAAFLLQAAVNDQQNVETHIGSVVWRIEESRRPNANGSPALRADVDIAAVGLRLVFLIEKNNDPTLRASHMLTFRFLPQEGSPLPGIAEMGSPQMRNESAPAVEPLAGAQAKITDNIYIVALSSDPTFAARNLETLRSRGWFDFPIRLNDGRIAKITIEKGAPGERLLAQAIDQWQR